MSSDKKNINYTAGDIEQYLAGNLSSGEMHAMEKAALDDPFLAEAMEGYGAMKDTEWNNELVALRQQITSKGAVAKVIPLHKSKNNRWKAVAAIFILGAGITLTFILNKDKTEKINNPQIAQNINTGKQDSLSEQVNEVPVSVTASLNPTASSTKEDVKANAELIVLTKTDKKADAQYIPDPGAPQLKPASQYAAGTASDNTKVNAAAPEANKPVITTTGDNTKFAEESIAGNSNQATKANNDAEVLNRQKNQATGNARKETALNNFFTAQVVAADNTPLPFTNISIKKENFGTYADAKGMVRLVSTDSILNIEVKSVGYLPKVFTLRNNQPQTRIVLQEEVFALKDKTVIENADISNKQKSRRATLLTDSAVNVEPADGWENYNTYVANNFEIPVEKLKSNFHGEVEISFDVKANGTISNIRVNKSLGAEYDEAAKRLIMEGPQWKVKKGRKTSASVKVQF
jgi:Gram-negative bacterial TonB protein C-terminal